ncbi:hypothetical protein RJ55_07277 [Drechmeria coniospora]|nr:hypothetical protein RJ55_07277 [Drechmeria coniospora]
MRINRVLPTSINQNLAQTHDPTAPSSGRACTSPPFPTDRSESSSWRRTLGVLGASRQAVTSSAVVHSADALGRPLSCFPGERPFFGDMQRTHAHARPRSASGAEAMASHLHVGRSTNMTGASGPTVLDRIVLRVHASPFGLDGCGDEHDADTATRVMSSPILPPSRQAMSNASSVSSAVAPRGPARVETVTVAGASAAADAVAGPRPRLRRLEAVVQVAKGTMSGSVRYVYTAMLFLWRARRGNSSTREHWRARHAGSDFSSGGAATPPQRGSTVPRFRFPPRSEVHGRGGGHDHDGVRAITRLFASVTGNEQTRRPTTHDARAFARIDQHLLVNAASEPSAGGGGGGASARATEGFYEVPTRTGDGPFSMGLSPDDGGPRASAKLLELPRIAASQGLTVRRGSTIRAAAEPWTDVNFAMERAWRRTKGE